MTPPQILVFVILAVAMLLFVTERLRADLASLLVMAVCMLTGLVSIQDGFGSFANPAVITVLAVFVISEAFKRSGLANVISRYIGRLSAGSETRLLLILMITAAGLSGFMNNIAAVAILMPAVVVLARQRQITPSRLLMPLAWAALLGGNLTLIGTPPNLLANEILQRYDEIEGFGFFDFLPTGLIVVSVGIGFALVLGRRLLPDRKPGRDLLDLYPIRAYLLETEIGVDSPLINQTVRTARVSTRYQVTVLQVTDRHGETRAAITNHPFQPGDRLLLEGQRDDLAVACERLHLTPRHREDPAGVTASLRALAEITLNPQSQLSGATLRKLDFRNRYSASVLAVRHHGHDSFTGLADIALDFGDTLLIETTPDRIDLFRSDPDWMVLDDQPLTTDRNPRFAFITAVLMITALVAVIGFDADVALALVIAAIVMIVLGVLTPTEAYQSINWQVIFLIAGMLPLGLAMETTGAALLLAQLVIDLLGAFGPLAVMMGLFGVTTLLTNIISNAATTVLIMPIAIDTALGLGVSPYTFTLAIVLAASLSFLSPIGHQVNLIIYGPGGYRFSDYLRAAWPLELLLMLVIALTLPLLWPF